MSVSSEPDILPLVVDRLGYAVGDVTLLSDISFVLTRETRTVILGANGAGKSLVLRLCHGLLTPTDGVICWSANGGHGRRQTPRHAMVFQRPVMLRRSVAANVDYALAVHHLPRAERRRRVAEALRLAGLDHLSDREAPVLSGGEQQRLAVARAWACRPSVLFLDEPTANLDPVATAGVERLINQVSTGGTKIVMTTHDLGQARRLADEVIFLHRGRLIEHTASAAFFAEPATAEARAFMDGQLLW